jgi:hypothetical protein
MKINNEKIEEIKVSKVESSGLENVVFLPHRFGNLVICTVFSWGSLLMLFLAPAFFSLIGGIFFTLSVYGAIKAYENREKL